MEDELCSKCNGSGEGMHDGTTCQICGGGGTNAQKECDYCEKTIFGKGKYGMHIECWRAGKAEHEEER